MSEGQNIFVLILICMLQEGTLFFFGLSIDFYVVLEIFYRQAKVKESQEVFGKLLILYQ